MNILLDTHIWLWYALGQPQLSDNLRSSISAKNTVLWLSSISIWEVLLLVEKKRIFLEIDPIQWIEQSISALAIQEISVNRQIAMLSRQIALPHQDPCDRFIAATAIHHQLILATVDTYLSRALWLPTLS